MLLPPIYRQDADNVIAGCAGAAMRQGLDEDDVEAAGRQAIAVIREQLQDGDDDAGYRPRVIYAGRISAALLAVRLGARGSDLAGEVRAGVIALASAPDLARSRRIRETDELTGGQTPGLIPLARALATPVTSIEHTASLAHVTRDVMRNLRPDDLDDLYTAWRLVTAPIWLGALAASVDRRRQWAITAVAAGYPKIDVAQWARVSRTTLDKWLSLKGA